MQYGLKNIRNIVLLSHSGAGKTSLSEAMLFNTKAITRLGTVSEGNTTSDYEPDEIKRKMSINLTILPCIWKDLKLNILDAPGYLDFVGEVRAGIRVSEGAVVLIEAASGVEVGTEQVWSFCEETRLPRVIAINKMDRDNADFTRTLANIQSKFGVRCIAVQLPIGSQSAFTGFVDLLSNKAYTGTDAKEGEVPAALQNEVKANREKLVEAIAETNDKLIEKYLGGDELSSQELLGALRSAVIAGKLVPVLATSGLKNIGVNPLMDFISANLPAPAECEVQVQGSPVKLKPGEDGVMEALVFKTSADPYVGKLTYFRVYTGVIKSNSQAWNLQRGEQEHIGQMFVMKGKSQEPVPELRAGDIGAVAKLANTNTGDTLASQNNAAKIVPVPFPEPIFSKGVYPKTKADLDKLGSSLARLAEEDQTLRVKRDLDTFETVLSGMGETQLDVAVEKMQRKFGLGVELRIPKVPYRETITVATKADYKHKKQTGGHGQYGHVVLELEPLPRNSGTEFTEKVVGGSVPRNFYPAVEKGVNEGVKEGILAGYPVVDVRVTLVDGSYHPVDSSEICFKIAGAGAVKKGLTDGNPILIEPIMFMQITVPDQYTGDIIGDLNTKRGRVLGMNPGDGKNVIEAQVPLAEVLRYSIDLKSMTQGRGIYTLKFDHYEEVPAHITQKVIADKQAADKLEKEKA